MRLELNLPALERLIGGDTEVEIHLREQIVKEFARRHLKEIAATATYQEAIAEVRRQVTATAKEAFDIQNLATRELKATSGDRLRFLIESLVRETAQKLVDDALLRVIEHQKRYWAREVEEAVKMAMKCQIEREVEEGIKRRLDAARNLSTG
jgi:uncharacterized membrane protein